MNFSFKKIIMIISCTVITAGVMSGCASNDAKKEAFEQYKNAWVSQDYESMYEMLSNSAKEYIAKDDFINRYTNIYGAMDADGIEITMDEENRDKKSDSIPFGMTMGTMVGKIELNGYNMQLVKEDKSYKINWNESLILPQMQKGDKVRVQDDYAKRGSILDRNGEYLATDGIVKDIGLHPVKLGDEKDAKIKAVADTLDISESYIEDQLSKNTNPNYFVPIATVLDNDERLQKLGTIDAVVINTETSRVYTGGEAIGSLVGYVDNITAEELEKKKDQGYSDTDKIGKAGLEQVYEDTLRGVDGGKIFIERGNEEITVAEKEPVNGKDIKTSIDTALQQSIYASMNGEKGASTAVDPKTGEVLAMVSSPSYDPNVFTTYTTKTIKEAWEKLNGEQFNNRFNDVYAPGSTMKLITAAAGLNSGAINTNDTMDISGLAWQKDGSWGGYNITRVHETSGPIGIREATKYSDNIFYGRVALAVGADKFIEQIKNFGIGEKLDFEYPMEESQVSNDGTLSKEILLADTGYGQGEIMASPLNVALAYSALGNDGKIMKPRLVISEKSSPEVWKTAINSEYVKTLQDAFSAVINDEDGMAKEARVAGHNIAGKTGTAEIKKTQDDTEGTENGWFAGLNVDDSKIAISMFIEDVKGRGGSSIPTKMCQKALEAYLN